MHLVVPPGGSFREPRRIELGARALTIGRAASCDVRVDLPGVDEEHAQISVDALVAVGPDCAVGDVPLDAGARRLVTPGDEIQIGSVVLALDGQLPVVPGAPRGPRIRVVEGTNAGVSLVVAEENREYIIGRSPNADLVLEDREVSREHLKVVRRGFSIFVFDQASTRGSWLGRSAVYQGSRIEWERPRMLKVGATVLSLDLPDEVRLSAPGAQASAPMNVPPRIRPPETFTPSAEALASGPPANIGVFHYEAKVQSTPPHPASVPPGSIPPPSSAGRAPADPHAPAPSHPPPLGGAGAPLQTSFVSTPPPSPSSVGGMTGTAGSRRAWKKQSTPMSKTSAILLLALAGLAVLGVLFVVFSLME